MLARPIQYIGIVGETNTIYCYCSWDQYNILLLYYNNNILLSTIYCNILAIYWCIVDNTIYCYCSQEQYNILLLFMITIQYIGIVQENNTIYCYCLWDQYNILSTIYCNILILQYIITKGCLGVLVHPATSPSPMGLHRWCVHLRD